MRVETPLFELKNYHDKKPVDTVKDAANDVGVSINSAISLSDF